MDLCAQQPHVQPSAQGEISLEQGVKGSRQDGGEVRLEKEGLVEGKENGDYVQCSSLNKDILVH